MDKEVYKEAMSLIRKGKDSGLNAAEADRLTHIILYQSGLDEMQSDLVMGYSLYLIQVTKTNTNRDLADRITGGGK